MTVFRYEATFKDHEEDVDDGTVVANDKFDALEKLRRLGLHHVHLKKLSGLAAVLKGIWPDVK